MNSYKGKKSDSQHAHMIKVPILNKKADNRGSPVILKSRSTDSQQFVEPLHNDVTVTWYDFERGMEFVSRGRRRVSGRDPIDYCINGKNFLIKEKLELLSS